MSENKKLAAILVRGLVEVKQEIKDTLRMLNLQKKNACVILVDNPVNRGMLKKCENYITFGEVSDEVVALLKEKRPSTSKFFSLHPPRGGFEREGIKKPFNLKGALGYRAGKIDDLIKKMI
ncbi:MAG: uL30 family ribosomal protein [Candidatus Woesearchaeota archaeon]